MKKFLARDKRGFTLTEIIFVIAISVVAVLAVISAWTFTYQVWISGSQQTYLRVDLMKALETMKRDVRLSSLTDMVFYPEEEVTYTGVSMPVADADENGLYTLDVNGKIEWDRTVIYHVYTGADGKKTLRRTVYDPRDNTMTEEELPR